MNALAVRRAPFALALAVTGALLAPGNSGASTSDEAASLDSHMEKAAANDVNQAFGGYPVRRDSKQPNAAAGGKWGKATKDSEIMDGLFRIYKGKSTWHLQINPDQLGQQYILSLTVGRGIGDKFPFLGGMTLNDELIRFEKVGDKVLLYQDDPRFAAPGDEDLQRAIELSFAPSVIHSFDIAAERNDSLLIDLGKFLVSDYADVGIISQVFLGDRARLDSKRSTLGKLQVFEKNLELEADLTYTPGNRVRAQYTSVADDRFVPITIHYSIVQLPEPGYVPRLRDDRIGYFLTTVKDFTRDDHEDYMVHYANRWRLQKKTPGARVSDPVKPITFYLENTIPAKWRPYIKEGVEEWQRAFEKAGFSNAIVALPQPDDPDFDAASVEYSSIRWISSFQPAFGAIGPSRTDPRTGEIFDADILVDAFWIQAFHNTYRRYAGPETVQEALDGLSEKQLELARALGHKASMCQASTMMFDVGNLTGMAMRADGLLPPGEPVPDEFIGQTLKYLTMHEVGHTLGLRHNFQSSSIASISELQDESYIAKWGNTGSVMDYQPPNLYNHERRDHIYLSQTLGPYDYWAIEYGYTPSVAEYAEQEIDMLDRIAERSTDPRLRYGTDYDTYSIHSLDPRNNIFDLSSDPLRYSEERTDYYIDIWSRPDFLETMLAPGSRYTTTQNVVATLVFQYGRCLGHGLKYIGGQEVSRAHYQGPGSPPALTPVKADDQRRALAFLTQKAFAPSSFDVSAEILNRSMSDRTMSWNNNPYQTRIEYPFYTQTLAMQTGVLARLMEPERIARLRELELRQSGALTIAELFNELTGAIWGEFGVGSTASEARQNPQATMRATAGEGTRRDLQRAYVDQLVAWVLRPAQPGTDDARALARLQLTRIDDACERGMSNASSDVVRAHLLETQARIDRALNAEKTAEG